MTDNPLDTITAFEGFVCNYIPCCTSDEYNLELFKKVLALLKEQEKKEIKLHKKHVLTLNRNDEFSMRKLYESVCEKLLDEGEMVITRTDNHENVEFVFYVVND